MAHLSLRPTTPNTLDRLGFPALVRRHLHDLRDASRVRHDFLELVRTQVLLLAQAWTDQKDADLLANEARLLLSLIAANLLRARNSSRRTNARS